MGLALLIIFGVVSNLAEGGGSAESIAMLVVIAAILIIAAAFAALFKKAAAGTAKTQTQRPTPARHAENRRAVRPTTHAHTESEEAVRCAHSRGKQKYLEQLDSFLANGIIDRAEYKLMRERYEQLDIPDDFH